MGNSNGYRRVYLINLPFNGVPFKFSRTGAQSETVPLPFPGPDDNTRFITLARFHRKRVSIFHADDRVLTDIARQLVTNRVPGPESPKRRTDGGRSVRGGAILRARERSVRG
jgi:hypothetical protein